jgi:hypothetical protein
MNHVIMRKIVVTSVYTPLVASKLVASVSLSCLPTNTGNVLFKGDDELDVPWLPGEWHEFKSVNLADIQIKGNPGDAVSVIGGTW